MLATDLARAAKGRAWSVTSLTHRELDVTCAAHVRVAVQGLRPDAVVQTVGVAVDVCEQDPEVGRRVHAWGTACVARECERISAAFVCLSTCGLFGDDIRFYGEYDTPVLKTEYARSKHEAERLAQTLCRRTYVVRPGWLFGGTPRHVRNFVVRRWEEARQGAVIRSAGDKFGSPTFTEDLAHRILDLLDAQAYGLYHVSNMGGGSRYEYVRGIVEAFGLGTIVERVDSSHYPRAAPVPDCEMLDNINTRFLGLPPLPPWQDAIACYVARLRLDPAFA
jgi:dTDP-4-dehydrorhamnose reductase